MDSEFLSTYNRIESWEQIKFPHLVSKLKEQLLLREERNTVKYKELEKGEPASLQ